MGHFFRFWKMSTKYKNVTHDVTQLLTEGLYLKKKYQNKYHTEHLKTN